MQAWKTIRLGLRSCNASSREANNALRLHGSRSVQTEHASSERAVDGIKIPYRIQRGPTDILKALSSTVSRDSTAPHYKYHDDPFLSPMSNSGKRNFAMAREAGRKAAKYIRAEHPELFESADKQPQIEEGDEAALSRAIEGVRVEEAIAIYTRMEESKQPIGADTRQSLLELLCFYNCEQPLDEDLIEERWFRQGARQHERQHKTWKDGGAAEKVFASLPPTPAAVSALVQGMARFAQADRALEASRGAGDVALASGAYDAIVRMAPFLREGAELRWKLVLEVLTDMSSRGVAPSVLTLNATLETLASMRQHRPARNQALLALAEFVRLGIEPSLATFYHLIVIYSRDRGSPSTLLSEIVSWAEGRSFAMRDPLDAMFFSAAMESCRQQRDVALAHRLHALLLTADNYNLIGDSLRESVYYRHYFALVCTTEPLDVFMAFYDKLVPNIYTPEPGVMEEVLRTLEANGAAELYPRIWSDMRVFDHADRESLVAGLLSGMVKAHRPEDAELAARLADVAWEIWTKVQEPREGRYNKLEWTGAMLGDVMTLSLRAGETARAALALARLATVPGVPSADALQLFVDVAIVRNEPAAAVACVAYAANAGFPEAGRLAAQLSVALPLNAALAARLEEAVGADALEAVDVAKESGSQDVAEGQKKVTGSTSQSSSSS